jgi:hypothetical protein
MAKASRDKGARGELAVLRLYQSQGWTGTRGFQSGGQGGADLAGTMPDAVEVKNCERILFWDWISQASHAATVDVRHWCLWIKSNRKRWVVVLDYERYLQLIACEREMIARERKENAAW